MTILEEAVEKLTPYVTLEKTITTNKRSSEELTTRRSFKDSTSKIFFGDSLDPISFTENEPIRKTSRDRVKIHAKIY